MPSILHKTSSISHLAWSNSFARRGSVWPFSISTSPCATRLSFVLNRNCREDEGRSLGIALQEGIPNHLKRLRTKSEGELVSETSPEATCLPIGRHPVYRRHELNPGFSTERGRLVQDAKGKPYKL